MIVFRILPNWKIFFLIFSSILILSFSFFREFQKINSDFEIIFFKILGESSLIRLKSGHKILIDGGENNEILEKLNKVFPFWDRKIDVVFLSHPHDDHFIGLMEVVKSFEVGKIFLTGVNCKNKKYLQFLKIISEKKTPVVFVDQTKDLKFGNIIIDNIFPKKSLLQKKVENLNNSSIVSRVKFNNYSFLFTGDLEKEKEKEIISDSVLLKSDVLKVGHHGSKTSSSKNFLKIIQPQKAVIQPKKNIPNLTIKKLEEKLIKYWITFKNQDVVLKINQKKINIFYQKI